MPVDTLHPEYEARRRDWEMVRDALDGERVVKSRRQRYLPAPPGMKITSNEVLAATGKRTTTQPYDFYQGFAEFPEIVEPALTGFQGVVHAREPRVKVPPRMEYLLEDATPEGDTLSTLWSIMTREVLAGGRVGILADVSRDDLIRVVAYSTENVTNWRTRPPRDGGGAAFVVVREVRDVSPEADEAGAAAGVDPFKTAQRRFWRELRLNGEEGRRVYQTRLWREPDEARSERTTSTIVPSVGSSAGQGEPVPVPNPRTGDEWTTITIRGNTFEEIPFIPVNAIDIGFGYGAIPILPLARRAYSVYRLTADYRRALYMKGDPQPYVAGIPKDQAPPRIGGDTVWTFPNADAKPGYLDIDGDGIPHMRTAIQDELTRFDQEGGRLLSTTLRPESGDALKQRLLAHQVTLRNVVINVGHGLERMLKTIARMLGLDPDEVGFEPDLDFASPILTGTEAGDWAKAQKLGFPVSSETLHSLARRGGVTEKTFEEELEKIEEDSMSLVTLPSPGGPEPPGDGGSPGGEDRDGDSAEPDGEAGDRAGDRVPAGAGAS